MKLRMLAPCCIAIFLAIPVNIFAASGGDIVIWAATPQGARVISQLERARHLERANAQSYTAVRDRPQRLT